MNKNLLYWISSLFFGIIFLYVINIPIFQTIKQTGIVDYKILLKLVAQLVIILVIFHIFFSGSFIRRWYLSVPTTIFLILGGLFRTLHWEYGHILQLSGNGMLLLFYSFHFFIKREKSNIDIPIFIFILIWETVQFLKALKIIPDSYQDMYWMIPAIIILITICITHIVNEIKKIKG